MLKTRVLLLSLVIVLIASLFAIGCAPTAAPGEVIQLKYNNQNPEAGWDGTNAAKPWLAQIEKATNGRVKFTTYFAQSLTKGPDAWQATKSGIADVSWCFHGYWPTMTPIADVMSLPFMPFKSAEQASGILWELMEKFPSVAKQFAENKILITWTSNPYILITTKKQVKTMEDLKGMKIRVTGGPPIEQFKLMGATPQTMPMPDVYENMQKGVIDGMAAPWEAMLSFRLYEVAKFWTLVPLHTVYFTNAMNLNTWNKLPPDVQKQVMSVCGLSGSKFYGKNMFDTASGVARDAAKKAGITITEYTLPNAEVERWREVAGLPLWNKCVESLKAGGCAEAGAILDFVLSRAK
jgi:TRAP-type C4-dicarboxylate transport system substrate-binding protein